MFLRHTPARKDNVLDKNLTMDIFLCQHLAEEALMLL